MITSERRFFNDLVVHSDDAYHCIMLYDSSPWESSLPDLLHEYTFHGQLDDRYLCQAAPKCIPKWGWRPIKLLYYKALVYYCYGVAVSPIPVIPDNVAYHIDERELLPALLRENLLRLISIGEL